MLGVIEQIGKIVLSVIRARKRRINQIVGRWVPLFNLQLCLKPVAVSHDPQFCPFREHEIPDAVLVGRIVIIPENQLSPGPGQHFIQFFLNTA